MVEPDSDPLTWWLDKLSVIAEQSSCVFVEQAYLRNVFSIRLALLLVIVTTDYHHRISIS